MKNFKQGQGYLADHECYVNAIGSRGTCDFMDQCYFVLLSLNPHKNCVKKDNSP